MAGDVSPVAMFVPDLQLYWYIFHIGTYFNETFYDIRIQYSEIPQYSGKLQYLDKLQYLEKLQ